MKLTAYPRHTIDTMSEAYEFLEVMIDALGLAFHPDTPVRLYEDEGGVPTFPYAEARRLDSLVGQSFQYFNDIYDECIEIWREKGLLGK